MITDIVRRSFHANRNNVAAMRASTVAVVLVHYGDEEITERAISSILRLTPGPGKVFLVNNGPGAWAPARSIPGIKVIDCTENSGYAGAVNRGALTAREEGFQFVWILNNDVLVDPLSIRHFLEAYACDPTVEILGSYVLKGDTCWYGGGTFSSLSGRAGHEHFGELGAELAIAGTTPTDWINGCSMFIPISSFETRGWFDESLFLYKEELEWQTRIPRIKAQLLRQRLVDHEVGATTGSTDGQLGRVFMARNGLILALRQRGFRRLFWTIVWAWDNGFKPLAKRQWSLLRDNMRGASMMHMSPHDILASL